MSVFGWMNEQILRMVWLNDLVGGGVRAVGLDPASPLGGSVQFFVYDVIKIFALLSVLIFTISWVQSRFPPERTCAMLGGRSGLGANTVAALLGTLTPFCSCSSTSAFFTQSFSVSGVQPIFAAIDITACQRDGCYASLSRTSRTARSRTSGENVFVVLLMMLQPTQELEPPANPARFSAGAQRHHLLNDRAPEGHAPSGRCKPRSGLADPDRRAFGGAGLARP